MQSLFDTADNIRFTAFTIRGRQNSQDSPDRFETICPVLLTLQHCPVWLFTHSLTAAGQSKQWLSALFGSGEHHVQQRNQVKALGGFKHTTLHFWHKNNHCLITHDLGLPPTYTHTHTYSIVPFYRDHRIKPEKLLFMELKLSIFPLPCGF